jgi:hypothetical protein
MLRSTIFGAPPVDGVLSNHKPGGRIPARLGRHSRGNDDWYGFFCAHYRATFC